MKVKQKFIAYKNATDTLFSKYDAVVVYIQRNEASLKIGITPFVVRHKENKKLLVVHFLPMKPTLPGLPEDVDALTSPSPERYAEPFMINTVAAKVLEVLKRS